VSFFYWLTTSSLSVFFKLFYRHKVYGLEHVKPGRNIIAPNHTSFFDPPLIGASCPGEISFLARKTLFDSCLFGWIIRKLNAHPIDVAGQDLASLKLMCQLLAENKTLVIFPEGMRSRDGKLGAIKSGIGMLALRCQSPITPVYLSGAYEVWSRYRRFPKLTGRTACVFGTPIEWQRFQHLSKKESQEAIAVAVKDAIENLAAWYHNGAKGSPP
jgi:1-acyl-sn-glycerol-3-phosphate acyltransferase